MPHTEDLVGLQIKNTTFESHRMKDYPHEMKMLSRNDSLFQAVCNGQTKKVLHLLNQGASLNIKNSHGFSPLIAALHIEDDRKRNRMFTMLLKKGASYTMRDDQYARSVMHWVCILGHNQLVSTLLEETAGDINLLERDKDGLTALHHAVLVGRSTTVEVLVKFHVRYSISVDIPDNLGLTPYIHARRLGYKDIADILQNQGLACEEHADNLFRSSREWSFVGKNERQRELDFQIQDQIKATKLMGKFSRIKKEESSTADTLNEFHLLDKVHRSLSNNMAEPISCLEDAAFVDSSKKSLTKEKCLPSDVELITNKTMTKSSLETFEDYQYNNSKSDLKVPSKNSQFSTDITKCNIGERDTYRSLALQAHTCRPNLTLPVIKHLSHASYSNNFKWNDISNGSGPQNNIKPILRQSLPTAPSASSNQTALFLIEQTFPKEQVKSDFHHSVFDTSKAAEYTYMFGNLKNFMEMLSEQNTRSYRKTVTLPESQRTLSVNKNNTKISTWAILFGDKKENGTRRKCRHLDDSLSKSKISQDTRKKSRRLSIKSNGKGNSKSGAT